MEHWQKILAGATIGTFLTIIFFYIFDKLFQLFQKSRQHSNSNDSSSNRTMLFKSCANKKRSTEELDRFVHEEFETARHVAVASVLVKQDKCVGICAFLQDRTVEYFEETFPKCCLPDLNECGQSRAAMAAISAWAPKWRLAEAVTLLHADRSFVQEANNDTFKLIAPYEDKYDFKLECQWTDNYMCDSSANEELWEGLIDCSKRLLEGEDEAWVDFPCEVWERTRIRVNGDNFHQVPHPGTVDSGETSAKDLIAL